MQKYEEKIITFKSHMLGKDSIPLDVCENLKDKIIALEPTIINLGVSNYKEAPENSITTRHQYYNLIDYLNDDLKIVKEKIINNCKHIIGRDKFLVKMWANIFRNGEQIKKHIHYATPVIETDAFKKNVFKTICGNVFVYGDSESETIYYLNEKKSIKNNPGDMHLFCCIVEHETLPYQGNLRISIAFDVYTETFFEDIGLQTPPNLRLISE
jgi:hypothetical protein